MRGEIWGPRRNSEAAAERAAKAEFDDLCAVAGTKRVGSISVDEVRRIDSTTYQARVSAKTRTLVFGR